MVRKCICFFIGLFLFCNVYALENKVMSEGIMEYVNVNYEDDVIKSIDFIYDIPNDYNNDSIVIVPGVFKELSFINKDFFNDIKFNIYINNMSNYDYYFNSDDMVISELEYDNIEVISNTSNFSNKSIIENVVPYRCLNKALLSLYGNDNIEEYLLNDDFLYSLLNKKGYKKLSDYYLDFYNKEYGLKKAHLKDFPIYVINDLFNGKCLNIKESSAELITLAYNHWYKDILYMIINNIKKNMYDYMNNKIDINNLLVKSNNIKKLINGIIGYNKELLKDSLKPYGYEVYMEITLKKEDNHPPKTGI